LPLAINAYAPAQNTIGYLYKNGLGVQKDYKEAVKWYSKAADGGHLEAMFNLANAYRLGKCVNVDFSNPLSPILLLRL